ncbi:MAG: hypothetical protein V1790_16690 [Planctomycetota bacterium]
MTLPAERPFAPKGRRTVATGGVRRSRTEPVVFGDKDRPAPAGRRNRKTADAPTSSALAGAVTRLDIAYHGFRFARLAPGCAPPVVIILTLTHNFWSFCGPGTE